MDSIVVVGNLNPCRVVTNPVTLSPRPREA